MKADLCNLIFQEVNAALQANEIDWCDRNIQTAGMSAAPLSPAVFI